MKVLSFKLLFLGLMFCLPAFGTVDEISCTTTSACNGSTTTFTFGFPLAGNDTSTLIVILRKVATGAEEVLIEDTHYTVSSVNNDYSLGPGGTVTTVSTYDSDYTITLLRDTPLTQDAVLVDTGVLRLKTLEATVDKLTLLVQELQEELARAIRIPRSDTGITTMLDDSVSRASMVLGFDSDGGPTALDSIPEGSATVSAFGQTLIDDADADAAKTTLEVPTITAAAETVLDDTTVAAMCTTLGAVQNTGDETIAGAKTFSGAATFSVASTLADSSQLASSAAPTSDADIANKKYCDDAHKPYARMFCTAAQNNLTDITWTTITLDTDTFDSGTITSTADYKITPAVAGYYLCIGQLTFTNVVAEKSYSAQLYFNGTTAKAIGTNHTGAATSDCTVNICDVILFDSDDYIQLRGYVNCGAATVDVNVGTEDTYLVLYRM